MTTYLENNKVTAAKVIIDNVEVEVRHGYSSAAMGSYAYSAHVGESEYIIGGWIEPNGTHAGAATGWMQGSEPACGWDILRRAILAERDGVL